MSKSQNYLTKDVPCSRRYRLCKCKIVHLQFQPSTNTFGQCWSQDMEQSSHRNVKPGYWNQICYKCTVLYSRMDPLVWVPVLFVCKQLCTLNSTSDPGSGDISANGMSLRYTLSQLSSNHVSISCFRPEDSFPSLKSSFVFQGEALVSEHCCLQCPDNKYSSLFRQLTTLAFLKRMQSSSSFEDFFVPEQSSEASGISWRISCRQ